MAKEKHKKVEDLSDDELAAEITAQTETLFKYRFQLATGQLENPMKMRGVGKEIDTETKTGARGTVKVGVVTSDRMTKTVVVKVESLVKHRDYHRFVKRTSTFMAHDERGDCHVGDTVEIIECRPLSKSKRWRVQRIIGKAVRIEEPQTGEGANA